MVLMADIHSNIHALLTAMDLIRAHDPGMVMCAGDIVGYGANPNECCHAVESMSAHSISGNHDRAAISKDVSGMNPYAAAAALWTSDRLDDESRRFLSGLPISMRREMERSRVAVFHGSPSDPDEYVYAEEASEGVLRAAGCDLLVLGHTHMPFVRRFDSGLIVNPGSVGQPRDGDPRGSLAVVDMTARTCEIVRFRYDIQAASQAISENGLPHMLADRLHVGR